MSDQGIAFRATAGFVTDPANVTYCLADVYPTTRGGSTFGWSTGSGVSTRDRNSSVSPTTLAGLNFVASDTEYFQLDLPATGSTAIHAAFGDYSGASKAQWIIKDTTTTIATINTDPTAAQHWTDATNVERTSAADWSSNEAATTYTMASTALRCYANSASANTMIAFFRAVQASASASGFGLLLGGSRNVRIIT